MADRSSRSRGDGPDFRTMPLDPPSGQHGPGMSRRALLGLVPAAGLGLWAGCRLPAGGVGGEVATPLPGELWRASAGELAAAIARGEVSSAEVVQSFLDRIAEVNDELNAVTLVLADDALAQAARADQARAAGEPLGPLHGVPFTIKENIDVAGSPTTEGVPALADNVPERDATIVARLRAAGAIPLARTNLPDFGLRVHTTSFLHGLTRNPWDPQRNVGGSSGGEGAALASGMSCLGLGNDIGGSLRIPAQCNGIASLKPTFGRIPGPSGNLSSQLMAVDGPMARRVADLQTAFSLMAGYDPHDPWSMPIPLQLDDPAERRIALVPEPSGGPTHPAVAAGVRKAGEALAAAGWAVEEVEPPRLADAARCWALFLGNEIRLSLPQFEEMMSEDALRFLRWSLDLFGLEGFEQYVGSLTDRYELAREWQEFQESYPLIVGPVLTQPPFEVGYDVSSREAVADVLQQMRFETVLNLLGLPAVCVPVGVSEGLPQVAMIVGGRYRESLCLQAGRTVEDAYGILTPIDPVAA